MKRVLSGVLIVLCWSALQWSCQSAIEPTAEVVDTPVVVSVRDQGGQPINGARVQWIVTRRGASQAAIDAAFARAVGPQEAYTGSSGTPGYAVFRIPVPVADEQALILLKTTPPPDPAYRGNQKNGDFRLDTIIPCNQLSVALTLIRRIPVSCNQPAPCSDVELTVAPGQTQSVKQGEFVQTDADVIIASVSGVPAQIAGVTLSVRAEVGGQLQPLPASVSLGQPYSIVFTATAPATAAPLDTTLQVTITVTAQDGSPCWQCTFRLRLVVRPQWACDCPTNGLHIVATISSCVGSVADTTVRVGFANTNTQCNYRLQVQPGANEPELGIIQLNTTSGTSLVLPPGGRLDSLRIRFAPSRQQTITERFVIRIYRQTPQGEQLCDSMITVTVVATSDTPAFGIDSAGSTLFQYLQNRYVPDTLVNCTTRDDPRTSIGTLCLYNRSRCPVDLDLSLIAPGPFRLDTTRLRLAAGDTVCVSVKFAPEQSDVYQQGRCNPAIRDFRTTVLIRSSNQSEQVPVFGYAELDVQCASKATAVLYEFGTQDANGTRYYITINILQTERENTLIINEQLDGNTDSVEIYVQRINTTGPPPNDANITSAVLATGRISGVEFNIVARNLLSLPQDICLLFNQYGCSFDPTQWTQQPTVREGDLLIFRFGSYYGILWVKKLSWSNRSGQALPQVEVLTCYPFN